MFKPQMMEPEIKFGVQREPPLELWSMTSVHCIAGASQEIRGLERMIGPHLDSNAKLKIVMLEERPGKGITYIFRYPFRVERHDNMHKKRASRLEHTIGLNMRKSEVSKGQTVCDRVVESSLSL